MFFAGAANLEANKEWINELNVFPVPDGDTGTNMTLTIKSAVNEVSALGNLDSMKDICKAMSSGSLRGARGNSGVILSQLIRGFGKVAKSETVLTIPVLAEAFDRAVETAYKAVMKPKEGTILTVAKGAALKSRELADAGEENLELFLGAVLEEAEKVLAHTPELLPVLKEAGVVDSGGQGLVQVMKGAYDRFLGKEIDYSALLEKEEAKAEAEPENETPEAEALRFIYKMRMTVLMSKKPSSRDQKEYLEFLKSLGDRVKCAMEGDILHVKVQTNDPGLIIQRSQKFGELGEVRLINLKEAETSAKNPAPAKSESKPVETAKEKEKPEEPKAAPQPRKDVGFITVSVGDRERQRGRDLRPSQQQEYHHGSQSGGFPDERQEGRGRSHNDRSAGDHRRDQLHARPGRGSKQGQHVRGDRHRAQRGDHLRRARHGDRRHCDPRRRYHGNRRRRDPDDREQRRRCNI